MDRYSVIVLLVLLFMLAAGCRLSLAPTELPTSTPAPVVPAGENIRVREKDGVEMVYVEAGEFLMGSADRDIDAAVRMCNKSGGECVWESFGNEYPQHTVYLDAFWIDKTEVTNARYTQCVAAGACYESEFADHNEFNADQQPVVGVNWQDAVDYCAWAGARLPTEAEWEKAARGTDGRTFPWGDERANCDYAVIYDSGYSCGQGLKTWVVGSKPAGASPYGALDMAGNVSEWVGDWYDSDYYEVSPEINPQGPDSGPFRILRGGSLIYSDASVRAAERMGTYPLGGGYDTGFRCVVPSPPSP